MQTTSGCISGNIPEKIREKIEKLYLGMDENVVKSLAQIFPSRKLTRNIIQRCRGKAVARPALDRYTHMQNEFQRKFKKIKINRVTSLYI